MELDILKLSIISLLIVLVLQVNSQCFDGPVGIPNGKNIFCGYIISNVSMDHTENLATSVITGGVILPEAFDRIYNQQSATINVIDYRNKSCRIEICGLSTETNLSQQGDCKLFSNDLEYGFISSFHISSISCGCAPSPIPNLICGDTDSGQVCGGRIPITEKDTSCAVLYQESYCTDCYYDGIILDDNSTFTTNQSAAIKSLAVLSDCIVTQTTYGKLSEDFDNPLVKNFTGNISVVELSYHKRGEEFYCHCPNKLPEPTVSTTMKSQQKGISTEQATVLSTTGGISLIFIIFGGVFIVRRKIHQQRTRLTDEEIGEFFQGAESSDWDERIESDISAYTLALRLPYNSEVEINKKLLIFDIEDPESIVGDGQFGKVYKGKLIVGKVVRDVAIKTPVAGSQTKAELQCLVNEIKVMHYIGRHENIVEFIGACTLDLKKAKVFSIMELCPLGNLKSHLIAERNIIQREYNKVTINNEMTVNNGYRLIPRAFLKAPKETTGVLRVEDDHEPNKIKSKIGKARYMYLLRWAREIASGMGFLKDRKVLHIDLAARNVLLSEDLTAKICDFGLSRKLYERFVYERTSNGPMPFKWIAPECRTGNTYSVSSDVWAYSVTLWEIFSLGGEPYPEMSIDEVYSYLHSGQRLSIPKAASYEIYGIMLKGWNIDPFLRPSFHDLKTFFDDLILQETGN